MALPRFPISTGLRFPKLEDDQDQFGSSSPYDLPPLESYDFSTTPDAPEEGLIGRLSSSIGGLLHNTVGLPKQGIDWLAREMTDEVEPEGTTAGQIVEEKLLGKADPNAGFGSSFGRTLLRGGLDIGLDPTTYAAGLGVLSKAGKIGALTSKIGPGVTKALHLADPLFKAQMGLGVAHGLGEGLPELYEHGATGRAGELLGEAAISGGGLALPRLLKPKDTHTQGIKNLEGFAKAGEEYAGMTPEVWEGDAPPLTMNEVGPFDGVQAPQRPYRDPRAGIPLSESPLDLTGGQDFAPTEIPFRAEPPAMPDLYDPAAMAEFQRFRAEEAGGYPVQEQFRASEAPLDLGFEREGDLEGTGLPRPDALRAEPIREPSIEESQPIPLAEPPPILRAEAPSPDPYSEGGFTDLLPKPDVPENVGFDAIPQSELQQKFEADAAELDSLKQNFGEHSIPYQKKRAEMMGEQVKLQKEVEAADAQQPPMLPQGGEQLPLPFDRPDPSQQMAPEATQQAIRRPDFLDEAQGVNLPPDAPGEPVGFPRGNPEPPGQPPARPVSDLTDALGGMLDRKKLADGVTTDDIGRSVQDALNPPKRPRYVPRPTLEEMGHGVSPHETRVEQTGNSEGLPPLLPDGERLMPRNASKAWLKKHGQNVPEPVSAHPEPMKLTPEQEAIARQAFPDNVKEPTGAQEVRQVSGEPQVPERLRASGDPQAEVLGSQPRTGREGVAPKVAATPEQTAGLGNRRSDEGMLNLVGKPGEDVRAMRGRMGEAYAKAEKLQNGLKLVDLDQDFDTNPGASWLKSEAAQPVLNAIKSVADRIVGGRGRFGGFIASTDIQGQVAGGEVTINPVLLARKGERIMERNVRELARKGIKLTAADKNAMMLDITAKKIVHTLAHEQAHTEVPRDAANRSHTIAHRQAQAATAQRLANEMAGLRKELRDALSPISRDLMSGVEGTTANKYRKLRLEKNAARKLAKETRDAGLLRDQSGTLSGAERRGGAVGGDLGGGGPRRVRPIPDAGDVRGGGGGSDGGRRAGDSPAGLGDLEATGRDGDSGVENQADRSDSKTVPTFYSEAERQAAKLPQAMKGDDVTRFLHGRGVKLEEMKWTGLDDFLSGKPRVTPKEVQDFLRENRVDVKEVTLGGNIPNDVTSPLRAWTRTLGDNYDRGVADRLIDNAARGDQQAIGALEDSGAPPEALQKLYDFYESGGTASGPTKFHQYQLPGGENYRELLLTRPTPDPEYTAKPMGEGRWQIIDEHGKGIGSGEGRTAAEAISDFLPIGRTQRREGVFKGVHYDEPNVLAHVRFNERTDAQGKKVLFIEEIQSDWAQKGRKEGFAKGGALTDLPEGYVLRPIEADYGKESGYEVVAPNGGLVTQGDTLVDVKQRALQFINARHGQRPREGPFVGDTPQWSALAMKRMIRWAAENGFDKVAWTKGEQQAARYDLSKSIKRVAWDDTAHILRAWDHDGKSVIEKYDVPESKLADYIGKEAAEKIAAQTGRSRELSGLDLQVGGEGMKGFYDKILPGVASKLGRKFGARVGETDIRTANMAGELTNSERVHSMDVTPQMKQSVMEDGQALFFQRDKLGETPLPQEKFRIAESDDGVPPARLSREDVLRFEDGNKATYDLATKKTDDYFINQAARGKITPEETNAWKMRVSAKEQAVGDAYAELAKVKADGGDIALAQKRSDAIAANYLENARLYSDLGTNIRSRPAPRKGSPLDAVNGIIKEFKLNDTQSKNLLDIFHNDPTKLPDIIRHHRNPTLFQKVLEYQKAGMVSAIPSQIANPAGNLGEFTSRLGETWISGMVDKYAKGGSRKPAAEVGAELRGAMNATGPGLRELGAGLKEIFQLMPEKWDHNLSLDYVGGAIGKGGKFSEAISKSTGKDFHLGRFVRIPLRMLGTVDKFFQTVGKGAEIGKLSFREAVKDLGDKASTEALRARAAEIGLEIQEASTPRGLKLAEEVAELQKERTFQETPPEFVRSLNSMRQKHPWMQMILPFTTTPGNILRRVWQRSPAGAFKVIRDYRAGKFDGNSAALADAMARPILGTAMLGGFVAAAKSGLMTGSGPSDPEELAMLRSTGWQPYSVVKQNEDGTQTFIPFSRFEPVSSLLSMAADFGTLGDVKDEEQAERVVGTLISNLVSKTYLRGLSDAAMVISDPKKAGGQLLRSVAGTVVPNVVSKTGQAFDSTVYDTKPRSKGFGAIPEQIGNAVLADIPGSPTLTPRYDSTGKVMERPGNAFERAFSPFPTSTSKPNAPLVKELLRVGVTLPDIKKSVRLEGVDVPLSQKERELFAEGHQELEAALKNLTSSNAYKKLPDTRAEGGRKSKEGYIRSVIDGVNTRTRKKVIADRDFKRRYKVARKETLMGRVPNA